MNFNLRVKIKLQHFSQGTEKKKGQEVILPRGDLKPDSMKAALEITFNQVYQGTSLTIKFTIFIVLLDAF